MSISIRASARTVVALAAAITMTCAVGVVAADARSAAPRPVPVAAAPDPVAFPAASATVGSAPITAQPAEAEAPRLPAATPRRPRAERPAARRPAPAPPPACPALPRVPAGPSTRARVVVSSIPVYSSPGAAKPARTMSNPREEDGLPLDFLVRGRHGEWLKVQLPVRPNFTHGWVRVRDVELSSLPYRIVVERCARRLTVFDRGRVVLRVPVAVGKAQYPTPLGEFYVDYVYPFSMRSGYGPWLLSVAGFSDVLTDFAGGRGQIAIHGTNAPSSIGRAASHGCVRVMPEVSTRLSKMIKPGTPVSVVP